MPSRNVSLTEHFDGFIEANINSGQYKNASEVMRAGLQLLEQRQREDALRLEHLREAARKGFDELERGDFIEVGGEAELRALIEDLSEEAGSRVKARKATS